LYDGKTIHKERTKNIKEASEQDKQTLENTQFSSRDYYAWKKWNNGRRGFLMWND
jgi:hypothetical protein